MRRSSRLILLLGAFLALGAFILFLFGGGPGGGGGATPTPSTVSVVVAAVDIPQGTTITADMITTTSVPVPGPTGALTAPGQAIGQVTGRTVGVGDAITEGDIQPPTVNIAKELTAGERAMAIQVDQVSGVGTLIQAGDHVDAIITLAAGDIPVVVPGPQPPNNQVVAAAPYFVIPATDINSTSVKLVVQNVRVVATLVPPPVTAQGSPAPEEAAPALTGRQQIVIVALNAQQAEVLRYAQSLSAHDTVTGAAMPITLLLRSPADAQATPEITTGVVLRTLIDEYGVLPPQFVRGTFPPR